MKKFLFFAMLGAAAVAAFLFVGPNPPDAPQRASTDAAPSTETAATLTVAVAAPETDVWPIEIDANGWLAPWQEAVVSAEISGQRIVAVNADVGETVREGDVLVEFSRQSLENTIRQLEASLDSAQATLENATADADRARALQSGASLSQKQIAEYLASERQAKANVASAEAQLASAQLDLENARVLAVSDGIVSSRSAALGDVVQSGAELFRLIRDGRIEWQAEVPLFSLIDIHVGMEVRIPTPTGQVVGAVRRIAPTASEENGRVLVYVSIEQPEDGPEPKTGILIGGTFIVGESEALHVPSSAVVLSDGFSYVFTLEDTDPATVSRIRVETGRRQGDRVEITSDLPADSRIVQAGGAFLSDGSVVRVASGDATEISRNEEPKE